MVKFVVEHMEEELFEWCIREYSHMIAKIGAAQMVFTNLPAAIVEDPPLFLQGCTLHAETIEQLGLKRVCLLDSESPRTLSPSDASAFDYFLFGGILGNVDEFDFDKTKELRVQGFESRNLDAMQMTTDTAVIASWMILNGTRFEEIPFVDRPEIALSANERLVMNFRYIRDSQGGPLMAPGILALLVDDSGF